MGNRFLTLSLKLRAYRLHFMNLTKFSIFVFSLISVPFTFAQPYVWPTDASRVLSGTFAEYRPGHLHAGIDIKTWGQEGYRIFAIDSGSVVRLTVSPYDGGKGIMLRLNNGWRTVNYHLSRFTDDMEKRVRAEQIRQGKYRVQLDFPPGRFPVAGGEIIGYSGKTGVGYPHVHFEVVDENETVFNPLRLFSIEDSRPPDIVRISLRPMQAESHVDGDWQPKIYTPVRTGSGSYVLEDTIDCRGDVGFAYDAFDQPEGMTNQNAIYEARLFINDSLLFSSRYDHFLYDDWQYIDLDWDHQLMRRSRGQFRKLYVEEENPLPFYQTGSSQRGLVSIDSGKALSSFKIEIGDFNGNVSVLTGALRHCSIKDQAFDKDSFSIEDSAPIPIIHYDFFEEYVRFEIKSSMQPTDLMLVVNEWHRIQIPLHPIDFRTWTGILPLRPLLAGNWVILAGFDHSSNPVELASFTVHFTDNGVEDVLASDDGTFEIELKKNTLFRPFRGSLETSFQEIGGLGNQKLYSVRSSDFPLKNRAEIRIHPDSNSIPVQKMGIYSLNKNRLRWLNRRSENGWLAATVRSIGSYVALADTVRPVIHRIRPADQAIVNGPLREIKCWFSDSLSGISGEENYKLLLDGRPLIVAYDYEEESGTAALDNPPDPGYHRIQAIIRDRAGNIRKQESAFFVRDKAIE